MSVETELKNTVNNIHVYFNDFMHSCLDTISLRMMNEERRRYKNENLNAWHNVTTTY